MSYDEGFRYWEDPAEQQPYVRQSTSTGGLAAVYRLFRCYMVEAMESLKVRIS